MDGWQLLVDDALTVVGEVDEHFAPVGGVRMPLDQRRRWSVSSSDVMLARLMSIRSAM